MQSRLHYPECYVEEMRNVLGITKQRQGLQWFRLCVVPVDVEAAIMQYNKTFLPYKQTQSQFVVCIKNVKLI